MFLDRLSDYLSRRRGVPVLVGILLVILNFILQFVPGLGVVARSNLLLHLGVVFGLGGLLLSEALG